ncbi:hypothetical protein NDU88_000206 [Pleurodeles waltl]|uniref:Uncharacterized protein n=1 Tax=Pleurodeles waltl TaxID=8319 RepID=A0AAV7Q6Q6_PLEWA|nr:hypothetical protein NDU88_000206 [Pleurodeles waltl]
MHSRALRLGPHKWKPPVEREALITVRGLLQRERNHRGPMRERRLPKWQSALLGTQKLHRKTQPISGGAAEGGSEAWNAPVARLESPGEKEGSRGPDLGGRSSGPGRGPPRRASLGTQKTCHSSFKSPIQSPSGRGSGPGANREEALQCEIAELRRKDSDLDNEMQQLMAE